MLRRISVVLIFAFAGAGAALADPAGTWREKDGGTIQISHCGEGYCATIATVQPPLDPATGRPWTDKHNADPSKRSRPLVGVQVLTATAPAGPGKWSGNLYDSDRGHTLSGNLVELGPDTIRIEGCLMGLCGGEELRRVR
jgi:uncharacterized protein (DUF2147 family)